MAPCWPMATSGIRFLWNWGTIGAVAIGFAVLLVAMQVLHMLADAVRKYRQIYVEVLRIELQELFLMLSAEEITSIGVMLGLILASVSFLVSGNYYLSIVFGALGVYVPHLALRIAKKKRLEKFNHQLVDALAYMSNAMRAGQALPQALALVVREMPAPISQEFGILIREYNLGVPIDEALRGMDERVGSDELGLTVNAVIISRRTGGNITEVFDNIGETIRDRLRLEGKVHSLTAQGRMQGVVLACLPLFIGGLFFWQEPSLMRRLFTWPGILGALAIIVLEVIGWLLIRHVTNVEV